jgi:type I restriction enzyme, S subunit
MSKWCEVPFGSIAQVKAGFSFKSQDWKDSGVAVVRIGDVHDGIVDLSDPVYVDDGVAARASQYRLVTGDVLITMSGRIGDVGRVRLSEPALLNQRVGKFVVTETGKVDRGFLFFSMLDPDRKKTMESYAYGVAQPNISPDLIHKVRIPLPPLAVQRKVAAVLGAYDELIENNLRRIEILEEMAQAVYREWFVNFRFPGHEAAGLVDSPLGPIPDGWLASKLGDHVLLAYGKALKRADRQPGPIPVFGSSGVIGYHDQALVDGPGIVVGRKGNVGSIHWSDGDFFPIDTTFYVVSDLPLAYLLYNLRNQRFLNSDAAVPGLNRNQALSNPFIAPAADVLEAFSRILGPMTTLNHNLRLQNVNLRETRDLLLPKLVSGEIDLSDLDIDTEWLVA